MARNRAGRNIERLAGRSKNEIARMIKDQPIAGDQSRSMSLGAGDPRHRSGPDSAALTGMRYDPEQFWLDEDGRLHIRREAIKTLLLESDERAGGGGAVTVALDHITWTERDTGTATQTRGDGVSVNEIFGVGDETWAEWVLPGDIDRTQSVTLTVRHQKREGVAGKDVSYQVEFIAFAAGELINRAADQTFNITDHNLGTQNGEDTTSDITITSAMYGDTTLAFRFHLTRANSSNAPSTIPGIHGLWITYTTT